MTLPAKVVRGGVRHAYLGRIRQRENALPVELTRIAEALTRALESAEELLDDEDKNIRLRAAHALSQTASTMMRVLEVGELEARLAEVELAELARQECDRA